MELEKSEIPQNRGDLPKVLLSWFQGLSRLLVARTDNYNYGGGWPRGTQRRAPATVALLFRLHFSTWPGGGQVESEKAQHGHLDVGDSNTEVNRQFGALTRRTRPDLLSRHRYSSHRVLWSVFAPSRQGGAEKVRDSPKWSICQKFCSAGFKAQAAFWSRALTITGGGWPRGTQRRAPATVPLLFRL